MSLVIPLTGVGRGDVAVAGGKGANLGELVRAGLPVPPGFVVTTEAYREFVRATGIGPQILALATTPGEDSAEQIRTLFRSHDLPTALASETVAARQVLGEGPVAVRSSATAEDLEGASFAGQQDTYLDINGTDALLGAVRDCWASLWTARAMDYRARRDIDPAEVALAVVVQEMVDADAAGVMFTAAPTTGLRDRTVISAAWGLGESVVSGTASTDDLVVDTATGRVLSRTIAGKDVMTVPTGSGTTEQAVPEERRLEPVLDDRAAAELAAIGARIQQHFGAPQDVEWARASGTFAVVQARPITALPEPTADTPTDWAVPYPGGLYFRASIVEQLPDPLSPLFEDMIDGAVTRSLRALMEQAFGARAPAEEDIRFPTVNGYPYYFYRSRGFMRMLAASPAAVGKLVRGDAQLGVAGWRDHALPRYRDTVMSWSSRPVTELPADELLRGAGDLLDAGCVYYTAVQSVVPIAAITEIVFTAVYDRFVRRAGDPPATTFLLGTDSQPIRAEKSLYDLAVHTRERPALANPLRRGERPDDPDWNARFTEHLDRYGHVVYNLDFASPVPADHPGPLLDTLRMYLNGQGGDPHERQRRSAERRDQAGAALLGRLDPARRAVVGRLLHAAQATGPVREDALADIGLAWPAMRRILLELGHRLTGAGVLDGPDDVFWLRISELRAAALDGVLDPLGDAVEQRRALWRGRRRAQAPQMLPVAPAWIERALEPFMPSGDQNQRGDVIRGIGASAGTVTAPARILTDPADVGRMQSGDVLVARMTTPAWTSLFAMASAVVTDVGGPLSHSSIVAREYGIPAVLGTGVATARLVDGRPVRVDGDAGTVTLLDPDDTTGHVPVTVAPAPPARPWRLRAAAAGTALGLLAMSLLRRRRR